MSESLSLAAKVRAHILSGRAGLWFRSPDFFQARRFLESVAKPHDWTVMEWNASKGLTIVSISPDQASALTNSTKRFELDLKDREFKVGKPPASLLNPVVAIRTAVQLHYDSVEQSGEDSPDPPRCLLLLRNIERIFKGQSAQPPVAQLLAEMQEAFMYGKKHGFHMIAVSPIVDLPPEINRLFFVLEDEPPKREELLKVLETVETDKNKLPDSAEIDRILDSARGLTLLEAEQAFADSLVLHKRITAAAVADTKFETLRHTSQLTRIPSVLPYKKFAGSLDNLIGFLERCLSHRPRHRNAKPRGTLLVGPPGTGKTSLVGSLADHFGIPAMELNLRSVRSKWQGETDAMLALRLATAASMGRIILFIDELNHVLSGSSDGSTDGGTGSRILAELLTFMTDPRHDVYVIGSCNSTKGIDSAFTRAGRFDAHFFFDIPSPEASAYIWDTQLEKYGLEKQRGLVDKIDVLDWTGGEIEACCKQASMQDMAIDVAAQFVPIYARKHAAELRQMRELADNEFIDAERPGVYRFHKDKEERPVPPTTKPGRRIGQNK